MRAAVLAASFLLAVGGLLASAQAPQPPVDPKAAPQPPVDPKTPVPAPTAAVSDYFPAKKGTKWTYKYAESDVVMELKEVGADAKIDTLANGKVVASETLKLQDDGLYRTKINAFDITPPLKILDLQKDPAGKLVPKAKGTKWNVDVKVQQAQLKGEYTILDTVKVKILDGTEVDAVLVEAKLNIGGTDTTIRYWFAPNKGQVKVSYAIGGNPQEMELKKFEEGK